MPKLISPTDREYKVMVNSRHADRVVTEDDPIIVSFRQATEAINLKRQDYLATPINRQWADGNTYSEQVSLVTFSRRKAIDVFLTLSSCNITDANDQPVFAFRNGKLLDKTLEEFLSKWGKLWPEWGDAIWLKCIETNPTWGFAPQEEEAEPDDSLPLAQAEPSEPESE